MTPLQRNRCAFACRVDHLHALGFGTQHPHRDPSLGGVRSENRKRVTMTTGDQRTDCVVAADAPAVVRGAHHSVAPWIRSSSPMIGIPTVRTARELVIDLVKTLLQEEEFQKRPFRLPVIRLIACAADLLPVALEELLRQAIAPVAGDLHRFVQLVGQTRGDKAHGGPGSVVERPQHAGHIAQR